MENSGRRIVSSGERFQKYNANLLRRLSSPACRLEHLPVPILRPPETQIRHVDLVHAKFTQTQNRARRDFLGGQAGSEAWLIYAWIPGQSLADKLATGWRPALEQVLDLGRQLLELLAWLHGHAPPLVHRDVIGARFPSATIADEASAFPSMAAFAAISHTLPVYSRD